MSRYQKGKTNLDFTEARDSEWQWHQLGHMQVCITIQTDNHASTPTTLFAFSVSTLLVVWQEGHPACKKSFLDMQCIKIVSVFGQCSTPDPAPP